MRGPSSLPDDPTAILKGLYGIAHNRVRRLHQLEREIADIKREAEEAVGRYERAKESMVQWTIDDVLADKNAR